LKDLQGARDSFLEIRRNWPGYFWAERDLSFVSQSLGGYFLDVGLEQARLQAVAAGCPDETLETEARHIYLGEGFKSWEKQESARNYKVALEYTLSFVRAHQAVEQLRIGRKEAADYDDIIENPFLVDLVQRYRATMDELIAEEKSMRRAMILEAAALCVDPLFQVNDLDQALVLADQLHKLAPNNPIHQFVKATVYFNKKDWETANVFYTAFLKESSIASDAVQRRVATRRKYECEDKLRRGAAAGGGG